MNHRTTTPNTPAQRPRLRGHGATQLAPDAGDWLPPRTRITSIWTEDIPGGTALVYCYVQDTVRRWTAFVAYLILFAGVGLLSGLLKDEIISLWLFVVVMVPFTAGGIWVIVWYPEAGVGGRYPIDAEGRLLPKTKKARLKALTYTNL